jgi:hypothetical protein
MYMFQVALAHPHGSRLIYAGRMFGYRSIFEDFHLDRAFLRLMKKSAALFSR